MERNATITLATINCIELYADLDIAIEKTSKSRLHTYLSHITINEMFIWANEPIYGPEIWQSIYEKTLYTKNNNIFPIDISDLKINYSKFKKMYLESKTT